MKDAQQVQYILCSACGLDVLVEGRLLTSRLEHRTAGRRELELVGDGNRLPSRQVMDRVSFLKTRLS